MASGKELSTKLINDVLKDIKSSTLDQNTRRIFYPGEIDFETRQENNERHSCFRDNLGGTSKTQSTSVFIIIL